MALVSRKIKVDHDTPKARRAAGIWAAEHAVTVSDALKATGFSTSPMVMAAELMAEGERLAHQSKVAMGGPGDLELLHSVVAMLVPERVVETGVAYGWSSLAILAALNEQDSGHLVSVDMPYAKAGNEPYVGIVVPDRFRQRWTLIREPDRNGLKKAIHSLGGVIDLAHYDSDKSYWGRKFAYPIIWDALRPGGVFISDDIQDNFYFREFVEERGLAFAVTESQGKFVGIVRKPD